MFMKVNAFKSTAVAPVSKASKPFFSKGVEAVNEQQSFFKTSSPSHHFINSQAVQTKLNIGQPGDAYEKEADSTADKVVQRLTVQKQGNPCKEEDKLQKKEEEVEQQQQLLQRKPVFESNAEPPDDDDQVHRKQNNNIDSKGSRSIESRLGSSKGSGTPLSPNVNQSLSQAFGNDFSNVRIHNDSLAAAMSKDLNAQAFTHGNDIYFDSGKYDPASSRGKHLLAHELTHTLQQGKNSSVKRSVSADVPSIQKNGNASTIDATALGNAAKPTEGHMIKNPANSRIEVHLATFPVKQYSSIFLNKVDKNNLAIARPPFQKPKPPRNTKQAAVWRKDALPDVKGSLKKVIDSKNIAGNKYTLEVIRNSEVKVSGTLDEIAKEIVVPFWDYGGAPKKHEVEHKVDWQIAGGNNNVDHISNLILLDREANKNLGGVILAKTREIVGKILTHYHNIIPAVTDNVEISFADYDIFYDQIEADPEAVKDGSVISISNINENSGNNPINDRVLEIRPFNLLPNHVILKTAKSGGGTMVPGNYENDIIKLGGLGSDKKLKSITYKKGVKDKFGFVSSTENVNLKFEEESAYIYLLSESFYSGVLKDGLRINSMSPIIWDDMDFSPITGWSAHGKVDPTLDFLKGVDISFKLENSVFTLEATVDTSKLTDKLPKPFKIDYSNLTLSASSDKEFKIGGEIGFSLDKIGKGYVGASASSTKGFALNGKFIFDSTPKFKKAEIEFDYKKNEWSGGGMIVLVENAIKGVESGSLNIEYKSKKLTGKGDAKLSIPGIDTVTLNAVFGESGFCIKSEVILKKMKGIKSGKVNVAISKEEGKEYSLTASGNATADMPSIPNLDASFSVKYEDGLFVIEGHGKYTNPKLDGMVTVGVTNGTVDDEGKVKKDPGGKTLKFYGNGSVTLTLIRDLKSTLQVFIDEKGDVLISGVLSFHKSPFDPLKKEETFEISQKIPVLGVPFVNVFIEIGAGITLYLNWEPLIIDFESTLTKTPLEDIKKGKLGGTSTLKLHSEAKAGVNMFVKAAAGVQVAVAVVKITLKGSAGIEVAANAGVDVNAEWDTEKGFKLKDGVASITVTPKAVFELSGSLDVELDLFISKINVFSYPFGSIKKAVDITKAGFNSKLPVKFDENGQVKKPEKDSLPKFEKQDAETFMKQSIGMDESNPPPSPEEEAKNNIRQMVARELRVRKNQSIDLYKYSADIQPKILSKVPPKAVPVVLEAIEHEIRNIEAEDFDVFKNEILNSKDSALAKHARIDKYKVGRTLLDQSLITTLHKEVDVQAENESKKPLQRKPNEEGDMIQKQPDDQSPAPDPKEGNVSVAPEPVDYSTWAFHDLRDVYLSFNATPGVGDPDHEMYEAVKLELKKKVEEVIRQGREDKFKPGTDFTINELYAVQSVLENIEERYFLVGELMLDTSLMEIIVFEMQSRLALRAKQNAQYKPQGLGTSTDYTFLDFADVFNDLEEADAWLRMFAYDNEKGEAKAYVQQLREELKNKVASQLPLVLFTDYISADNDFITGLDNTTTLQYIYTIETILYTVGSIEKFTKENMVVAIPVHSSLFLLLDRQTQYTYRLQNSLKVLHFHLNIGGGSTDYRTIASAGLVEKPTEGKQMATDPIGIRFQLTELWKDFYYYGSGSKNSIYDNGNLFIALLLRKIRNGDCPTGVDPESFSKQVLFQWKQIEVEEKELLNTFDGTVKQQTIEVLDASEKKIRTEAARLNIEIPEEAVTVQSPMAMNMYMIGAMQQQANEVELAGIAEGSKQLAAIKEEIEVLDTEMTVERISVTTRINDIVVSFVAESDILDAPEQLRAGASVYLNNKKEALQHKQELKKAKELKFSMLRKQLESRFPSLASTASRGDSGDLETLGEGGWVTNRMVIGDIISKLQNIHKVKSELGDDISVWELHEIIPFAKLKMMITPNSFYDFIIEAKINREREDKEFWETFKLVVGLGLAALSFGSLSGPAAALVIAARAGSIAMDVYEAYKAIKDYDLQTSMANTDFDIADSLSHDEPSMFGLALSIVALVADIKDAQEIFNAAKGLLKKNIGKAEFLVEAEAIAAKGMKSAAAEKEMVAVLDAEREVKGITSKVDEKVEGALKKQQATEINTERHGKLFATKGGTLYKCSSPCEQLASFFEKELGNNDVLTARLNSIESRIRLAGGVVSPALQKEITDLSEVLIANRYFKVNVTEVLDSTQQRFRRNPPVGVSYIYKDEGGIMGQVTRLDEDSIFIKTEMGNSTVRNDYQRFLDEPGAVGLPSGRTGFERLHASGMLMGHESPFGIFYGPFWVNRYIQEHGIEEFISLARINPAEHPFISITVKKKSVQVSGNTLDFLDNITYHYNGKEFTVKVLDPSNPLSDIDISLETLGNKETFRRTSADYNLDE